MRFINGVDFEHLLKEASMKPRFKRDLKYNRSTEGLDGQAWDEKELVPIWNKSQSGGILLLQPKEELYLLAFESGDTTYDSTGRSRAAICDFCYTWQSAGGVGLVTFYPDAGSWDSVAYLCCKDLGCSDHVRTKTAVGLKSRTQIRENLSDAERAARLATKLQEVILRMQLYSVS